MRKQDYLEGDYLQYNYTGNPDDTEYILSELKNVNSSGHFTSVKKETQEEKVIYRCYLNSKNKFNQQYNRKDDFKYLKVSIPKDVYDINDKAIKYLENMRKIKYNKALMQGGLVASIFFLAVSPYTGSKIEQGFKAVSNIIIEESDKKVEKEYEYNKELSEELLNSNISDRPTYNIDEYLNEFMPDYQSENSYNNDDTFDYEGIYYNSENNSKSYH